MRLCGFNSDYFYSVNSLILQMISLAEVTAFMIQTMIQSEYNELGNQRLFLNWTPFVYLSIRCT